MSERRDAEAHRGEDEGCQWKAMKAIRRDAEAHRGEDEERAGGCRVGGKADDQRAGAETGEAPPARREGV